MGERVYTIGNPSGLTKTLGEGLISGLRQQDGIQLVQTTALISPGSAAELWLITRLAGGNNDFLLKGSTKPQLRHCCRRILEMMEACAAISAVGTREDGAKRGLCVRS